MRLPVAGYGHLLCLSLVVLLGAPAVCFPLSPSSRTEAGHCGNIKKNEDENRNGAGAGNISQPTETISVSRRGLWNQAISAVAPVATVAAMTAIALNPKSALAAEASGSAPATLPFQSSAKISAWPGIEYLEPLVELKLSVQALSQASADTSKYPLLQKRMEKFFRGGLISEKNYYVGLSFQYMKQIQYDKNELGEYAKLDQTERINSMEDTMKSLQALLTTLQESSKTSTEQQQQPYVQAYALQAKQNLDRWFALVPSADVEKAERLFVATRQADANRNGKLEESELATMDEESREVWKKRVALVGD
eukprot:CAMPEP_0198114264 /NCGR_PEP_ID=MMETSP1442-20131203/5694_1 /TAXON_ID= /ORGANISM="Craspedostauros australis, Strain CCMP3328" /LENGTH=307 /DNA_ID=CAMNT_0043771537 /DNA_START=48 /DNA_END=971 /DNA_ORIENTATION=-